MAEPPNSDRSSSKSAKASRVSGSEKGGKRPKKVRPLWVRRLKMAFAIFTMLVLIGILSLSIYFMHEVGEAKKEMPDIEKKMDALRTPATEILSSNGEVIQRFGHYRDPINKLDEEVPKFVQNAIIAAEDKRFWSDESGVDLISLVRVAILGARAGKFSQGGSTLEMQIAKLLTSKGEKTFGRKIHDIALAYNIGKELTKKQILQLYLNQVFFGSGAYGIKAAAEVYFGKSLQDLTISEAALLARCVRRPSDENPFRNLDRAISNRDVVLNTMVQEHMITDSQYEEALNEKVHLNRAHRDGVSDPTIAPYFVEHVRQELKIDHDDIKLDAGGYRIQTTLDTRAQRIAEAAVKETVREFASRHVNTAAFVLMDAKGNILAEVGGPDFKKNQYNIISQAHRQPGSSFKPFLYSAAILEQHMSPDTYLSNASFTYTDPQSGAQWTPHNSSKKENKPGYSMREALSSSVNIPAAHTILAVGVHNVAELAYEAFGFKRGELREFPSLSLGASEVSPLEMASAYSVFMLRGNRAKPHVISGLEDADHNSLSDDESTVVRNVLSPEVCDQIDSMLRNVVTGGTGTAANVIPDARGKTGTTSDFKDAWFCGYSNGLIGIGWVGHQVYDAATKQYQSLPMAKDTFGGTVTAKMWAKIMGALPKDLLDKARSHLASVVNGPSMSESGAQGQPGDPDKDAGKTANGKEVAPDGNQVTIVGQDTGTASTTGGGPDGQTVPGENQPDPASTADQTPVPTQSGGVSNPAGTPRSPTAGSGSPSSPRPGSVPTASTPDGASQAQSFNSNAFRPAEKPVAPTKPQEEMVSVDICVETGLVANQYCPEVVTKHYRRSRVPKRKCTLHHG